MSYFTEHFWGEKNHGFDVLYHNMKHGQISTKELADFVRERAAIEENYAKAMVKLSKMATNGTQLGTFAPLWEVFRISSDKLALCHLELMKKLHDLIKEISRYGEEQGRVHKKSKEEVSGTLEAVQMLHGVAQLLPKSKESYHSKCQEYERLRKEGTSQKEIDKAELKSKKAGEALRRAVDKYNAARADFEQRMLDSAMRFQEVEEAHLRHMKGLIGSYSHSVEDTHVQIGQVHEEFKQNVENIGTEMLLRRFAESKGTGRERPGVLDFEEYRLAPAQEGPKRSRSKAFRIPGLSRKERDRDAGESLDAEVGCPEVDEDGFTVRPDITRTEVENHVCSSSDSDYDEDEPRKFYVHIKPVQPREAPGSAEATMEQLKATVGNLILPPSIGGTVKRQSSRHVASLTPAPSDVDPEGTLAAGDSAGRVCPAAQMSSGPGKAPPAAAPPGALFGPPLESAFEAEEFPAPRAYVLTSSSSPFSSSSPENVEDSGLDSPSHPAPGPSPDSRPWTPQPGTPQSPLPKQRSPPDPPPPALPRPRSPAGRLPEPPGFAVFTGPGAEGLWGDAARGPRGRSSRAAPREAPSPDPFGEPLPWVRPRSPGGDQPRPSSNSASSSSSSPAPPSGGESSSPSPWTCQGSGSRLSEGSASVAPLQQPDAAPAWPSAAPRDVPLVAPPRRSRTKRPAAGPAAGSNSDLSRSLSPSPSWSCGPSHSAPASLGERGFFAVSQPALGLSRGPSPVVLGSQDALPVATAFTEYVHAYFKGRDADSCLVKVTGELTMSFPAGIIRVFSGSMAPPVLSFRLLNTGAIEQFLPNVELLYSDPSQSDPSTKDFWLNMAALTGHLQKQAEQSPAASYYNVALLKYQFSRLGPGSAPLRLCVRWDCTPGTTRVNVEYGYNGAALALPVPLANVHVLLPVDEPIANLRLQPAASWNLEEKRLLWRLLDVPGAAGQGGCGQLSASWEPLCGPSKPSPVAAQFSSEGSTLSGVEVELASAGYRMSLVKKRFATGIYLAGS
ncbi:F-BAR domain only protein 1-like isoform X3 [Strigops habroptila]|uniref:FCH and mu domain containing endocytic adaptor 1 n=1 Tax=Strigops habroptila TaxID=2489341 RepID=A0A672TIQ2_STRHB|nr:F-BAR domain only protein 1-like isoform X3 [Strigops habroptila]XP_030365479.1 F-BAR domain only protein 1-like isoform X3 [Strigops habroptila]